MIKIADEAQCCGCGACKAACPVGCIEMKEGTLGSVFPTIDFAKCIKCDKCTAVCPMLHMPHLKFSSDNQSVFAAYANNAETRFDGSSGGIFGVFSKYLLLQGYHIYGAAFDDLMQLKCMTADSELSLKKLMKSKYLQCDMTESFRQIRQELLQGGKILFVSTPCQVAALLLFLGKKYDNLITIDFLCHGVPSQTLFNQCVSYENRRHHYRMLEYSFRTKIPGGATPHYFSVRVEKNGKIKKITAPYFYSIFYAFFQQYVSLRESCYECIFAEKDRVSDITIGDFHTIEEYLPDINRMEGVSTVILNTSKGETLFDNVKNNIWCKQFSMEQLLADKVLFSEKTKRPKNRDEFIKWYETKSFDEFVRRNTPRCRYFLYAIYYKLPRCMRLLIKKACHIK